MYVYSRENVVSHCGSRVIGLGDSRGNGLIIRLLQPAVKHGDDHIITYDYII